MRNCAWNVVVKDTVAVGQGEGNKMSKIYVAGEVEIRRTSLSFNLSVGASATLRTAVEKRAPLEGRSIALTTAPTNITLFTIEQTIDFPPNRLVNGFSTLKYKGHTDRQDILVTAPLGFALWINCFSFDTTSEPHLIVDGVDGALEATKSGCK